MGGGASRVRANQVAPEYSGDAAKSSDSGLHRAWSTADLDDGRVTAGAVSHFLRRQKSWEPEREARHRASGENTLRHVALLWERANSIELRNSTCGESAASGKSLVAARLHDAVAGLLPFLDEDCRNCLEAWAARPVLGTCPTSAHFSGRVIAEAIRATRQSESMASSLRLSSDSVDKGAAAMHTLSPALAAVREHEPPSPLTHLDVPKCLRVPSTEPQSAYSLGSVDKHRVRPRSSSADLSFRSQHDERLVRSPGEIDCADFSVEDCKDSVIQLLDCAGQVVVERCVRCQILLGAVQGGVLVRDCVDCTFRAACGQLRTRDCKRCDFLLWTPASPIIENSLQLRFGAFGAALPDRGVYTEQPAQLKRVGIATLAGEPWLSIVDFSPEWEWRSTHVSVLTEEEADEVQRAFPDVGFHADALSTHRTHDTSRSNTKSSIASMLDDFACKLPLEPCLEAIDSEVESPPPPEPVSSDEPLPPVDAPLHLKSRVRLEPLILSRDPVSELKRTSTSPLSSQCSHSPLPSPSGCSSLTGRSNSGLNCSEQLSQYTDADSEVSGCYLAIYDSTRTNSKCSSEFVSKVRKGSKKGDRRAAEGVPAILRLLLRQLKISAEADLGKAVAKLSQSSPADAVAPHLRKIATKLNNKFSKAFLAMVMEAFVERVLEDARMRSVASPLARAFQPSTLNTLMVSVAQLEQRTQWPQHEICSEGAPAVSEERLDFLLRASVVQFQKEFTAEVELLAHRLLASLDKTGHSRLNGRKAGKKDDFQLDCHATPEEVASLLGCLQGSGKIVLPTTRKDGDEHESEAQSLLPRFFVGCAAGQLLNRQLTNDIFKEARTRIIKQMGQRQLSGDDVAALSEGLRKQANEGITGALEYDGLQKVRSTLLRRTDGQKYAYHLSASTFLSMDRAPDSSVCVESLLSFVVRRANLQQCYVKLCRHDRSQHAYLTEVDIEEFVADFAASAICDEVEREFLPFYVLHATRRFMFFLDERRIGRIPISKIVCSPLLSELYAVRFEASAKHKLSFPNWFSAAKALEVYRRYMLLDGDGDGMLSADELTKFGSGMFSPMIIERIFQEMVTDLGRLDFKGYLDLTLACENSRNPHSIKFFWNLLDVKKSGEVDAAALRPFASAVLQTLERAGAVGRSYELLDPTVVVDEMLDFVGCEGRVVRLNDLLANPMGGNFIEVFCDGLAFWRYDNRESLARHNHEEDDDDEDYYGDEEEC